MESPIYSSSPSRHITVIDVYDLAESINRDFEKLVERFGNEHFDSVVRKVISALETLEALAKYNDKESSELLDLQKTIERFEQEKQQRLRDKDNLERDFMDLEENYRQEIDELCKIVQKLRVENKSMRDQISTSPSTLFEDETDPNGQSAAAEEQIKALIDLRKITQTQKERIKELQKDLDSYCDEVETLRESIERLIRQNKELLRKNSSLQKQGRVLLLERAEILRRLQQAEEEILQLRKVLNETSRACRDLEMHMQKQGEEESSPPCFTLSELREVLQEKNLLKAKVLELEERIDQFRDSSSASGNTIELGGTETPTGNTSVVSVCPPNSLLSQPSNPDEGNPDSVQEFSKENSDECLVFGPINREPEEKLRPWKYERKDSGVRKFFRFFKVNLGTSLTPRESSDAKLGEL
uniref:RILP-like protein n=1 Tax=Globodera rostochiensis TaxID=31243 RepID=A0A914H0G9_GLORO